MLKKLKQLGPGIIIAAAFIGPGTVTTASMAGAQLGYTLLWAVLFSIIATIFLQEMSVRLGVVAKMGVGDALRHKTQHSFWRIPVILLVLAAIVIGNAAYETGNISGAVLGFQKYTSSRFNPFVFIVGGIAFALLYSGKYKLIEKTMLMLVSVMGLAFVVTAISLQPDWNAVFSGLFLPKLNQDNTIIVVGLIGTTVVPYNLFLHASTAKQKWKTTTSLSIARWDTVLSIVFGGLITMAVLLVSAIAFEGNPTRITGVEELGKQLQPILGNWSSVFISFGFLAAGISSAITAPLAAAYATAEIMGWEQNLKNKRLRWVWGSIVGIGILFSSLGYKPTEVILFSQVANGILLPIVAIFLVWVANDKKLLKEHVNHNWQNILSGLVILIATGLGIKSILAAFGIL